MSSNIFDKKIATSNDEPSQVEEDSAEILKESTWNQPSSQRQVVSTSVDPNAMTDSWKKANQLSGGGSSSDQDPKNKAVIRSNDHLAKTTSSFVKTGYGKQARYSGLTQQSVITVGVSDEMVDSVHSLIPKQNYYEWKQEIGLNEKFTISTQSENDDLP